MKRNPPAPHVPITALAHSDHTANAIATLEGSKPDRKQLERNVEGQPVRFKIWRAGSHGLERVE